MINLIFKVPFIEGEKNIGSTWIEVEHAGMSLNAVIIFACEKIRIFIYKQSF
jgi:hypothetical protein